MIAKYLISSDQQHHGSGPIKVSDGQDNQKLKIFFKYFLIIPPPGRSCASCKSGAASGESMGGRGVREGTVLTLLPLLPGWSLPQGGRGERGDWTGGEHQTTRTTLVTALHCTALAVVVI